MIASDSAASPRTSNVLPGPHRSLSVQENNVNTGTFISAGPVMNTSVTPSIFFLSKVCPVASGRTLGGRLGISSRVRDERYQHHSQPVKTNKRGKILTLT